MLSEICFSNRKGTENLHIHKFCRTFARILIPHMTEAKHFVYQDATIEFVTVAAQTCLFTEHTAETNRHEFIAKILCLLPLLYLKTRLLNEPESLLDGEPQHFVQEEDYNYIQSGVKNLLGTDDAYLEVFLNDIQYSDEPITAYISENLADIYQN